MYTISLHRVANGFVVAGVSDALKRTTVAKTLEEAATLIADFDDDWQAAHADLMERQARIADATKGSGLTAMN